MPKTTTLTHCHFQITTPFNLVPFTFDQGYVKESLAQITCKMHQPISFGPSSKLGFYHDAKTRPSHPKHAFLCTKSFNHTDLIPFDLEHVTQHFKAQIKVNFDVGRSQIQEPEPCEKFRNFPNWIKNKALVGHFKALGCTCLMLTKWIGVQIRSELAN